MKIRTILSKLYISVAFIIFILSVVGIYNDGSTSHELEKIKLHNKVAKTEKKDQIEKEKIRENKKKNGIVDPTDVPQWEDTQNCYDYDGEYSKNAGPVKCLVAEDFPDGSLVKGVVFDLGILLAEIAGFIFLYAWIIWIFAP